MPTDLERICAAVERLADSNAESVELIREQLNLVKANTQQAKMPNTEAVNVSKENLYRTAEPIDTVFVQRYLSVACTIVASANDSLTCHIPVKEELQAGIAELCDSIETIQTDIRVYGLNKKSEWTDFDRKIYQLVIAAKNLGGKLENFNVALALKDSAGIDCPFISMAAYAVRCVESMLERLYWTPKKIFQEEE